MRDGRIKAWNQPLGPRALAVISCALALLAAQPAGVGSAKGQGVAAVRMAGGVENAKCEMRNAEAETPVVAGRRETKEVAVSTRGGGSSFHVLATVEILQRLLAFELRRMERQVLPAFVFTPVCVGEEPRAMIPGLLAVVERGGAPAMGVEREFAIARCLLAPPLA